MISLPTLTPSRLRSPRLAPGPRVLVVGDTARGENRALTEAGYRYTVLDAESESAWRAIRATLLALPHRLLHAIGLSAAAHASLGTLEFGVPLVVSLHSHSHGRQFAGLTGQARRWFLGRVLARAAAVIVPGRDARADLLRVFPNLRRSQHRVHVIPPGIDTRIAEPGADLRHELGLKDDVALIGYLGRLADEDGLSLLLEAAQRLVRFGSVPAFHLVAWGADECGTARRGIERKGLARRLSLLPPEGRPLEQFDLAIAPSFFDAPTTQVMEALAAGVPVLGSDCPGLRELLEGTPARIFRTGEVAELETGLRESLIHPWSDDSLDYAPEAQRRFDARDSARRLVELYDRLLDPTDDTVKEATR